MTGVAKMEINDQNFRHFKILLTLDTKNGK